VQRRRGEKSSAPPYRFALVLILNRKSLAEGIAANAIVAHAIGPQVEREPFKRIAIDAAIGETIALLPACQLYPTPTFHPSFTSRRHAACRIMDAPFTECSRILSWQTTKSSTAKPGKPFPHPSLPPPLAQPMLPASPLAIVDCDRDETGRHAHACRGHARASVSIAPINSRSIEH
jgi:hypothetical protein